MKIHRKDAEEALITDLKELHAQREFWCGWYFHFSDLQPEINTRKNISTLLNFIKTELSDHKVQIYCCHDHDLLMFFPKSAQPPMENIKKKMHYLFATDPLLCDPSPGKHFSTFFCLHKHYDRLFMEAHRKLRNVEMIKPDPDLDTSLPSIDAAAFQQALEKRKERTRPQILIVDDHPFNRNMIAEAVGTAINAQIIVAKDGYEALLHYANSAPDMVFLDIEMPKLDGHNVLQMLSSLDPKAFIIMLTSKNQREDVIKAKENHACGYITKPFNVQKLHKYIDLYNSTHPQAVT